MCFVLWQPPWLSYSQGFFLNLHGYKLLGVFPFFLSF